MGIFDKWTKKTKDEQLAASSVASSTKKPSSEDATVKTKKAAVADHTTPETATAPVLMNGEGASLRAQEILLRAHITEKAATDEGRNVYTFVIPTYANKHMVKMAVVQMFGRAPVAVRISNRAGKSVRFGRSFGQRSNRKIARVYMKEGEVLSIHKGV